ncbi:MAG: hypothetical protein ACRDKB_00810 [Actinomycetota bacterium]
MKAAAGEISLAGVRRLGLAAVVSALLIALPGRADAAPPFAILVKPAVAPDLIASPSFPQWRDNAISSFASRRPNFGDRGTPAFFEQVRHCASPRDMVASSFKSWGATADPGSAFGPAYANETGNRLTWTYKIKDPSGQVNIAEGLTQHIAASPWRPNPLTVTLTQYGSLTVGIRYGPDGRRGTADDERLTSGTGAVDEIVGLHPGLGEFALASTPDQYQNALDAAVQKIAQHGAFDQTVSYTFRGISETSTLTIDLAC